MRSGQLATSVEQFGASWKVGGPKSCTSSTPGTTTTQTENQPSSSSLIAHQRRAGAVQQQHPNQLASAAIRNKKMPPPTVKDEPLCQRQWHIRIRAVRECSVLKAATFAQCHPQVSPVRFFK